MGHVVYGKIHRFDQNPLSISQSDFSGFSLQILGTCRTQPPQERELQEIEHILF